MDDTEPDDAMEDPVPAKESIHLGWIALALAAFALLYAVTGGFFSTSSQSVRKTVPARALYGPIEIKRANQVLTIGVENFGPNEGWAFVEGEVLDEKKATVLAFGGEYWHESGYDDGHWSERESKQDVVVRFPEPGSYYVKFKVEGAPKGNNKSKDITETSQLTVSLDYRRGSSLIFNWLAAILLIAAVVLNERQNRSLRRFAKGMFRRMEDSADDED